MQIPSLANHSVGVSRGNYLPVGSHVVEVQSVFFKSTRKSGLCWIAECTALESSSPEVRPGGIYSFCKPFTDEYDYGPAEIKAWVCTAMSMICAAAGQPFDPLTQYDDQFLAYLAAESKEAVDSHPQPARGLKFLVQADPYTTQAGRQITKESWTAYAGETVAAAANTPPAFPPAAPPSAPPAAPSRPGIPAPSGAPLPGTPGAPMQVQGAVSVPGAAPGTPGAAPQAPADPAPVSQPPASPGLGIPGAQANWPAGVPLPGAA